MTGELFLWNTMCLVFAVLLAADDHPVFGFIVLCGVSL